MYLKWGAGVSPRLAPTEPGRTKAGKLTWNQRKGFSRLTSGERDIQLPQQTVLRFPRGLRVLCNHGVQEASWPRGVLGTLGSEDSGLLIG